MDDKMEGSDHYSRTGSEDSLNENLYTTSKSSPQSKEETSHISPDLYAPFVLDVPDYRPELDVPSNLAGEMVFDSQWNVFQRLIFARPGDKRKDIEQKAKELLENVALLSSKGEDEKFIEETISGNDKNIPLSVRLDRIDASNAYQTPLRVCDSSLKEIIRWLTTTIGRHSSSLLDSVRIALLRRFGIIIRAFELSQEEIRHLHVYATRLTEATKAREEAERRTQFLEGEAVELRKECDAACSRSYALSTLIHLQMNRHNALTHKLQQKEAEIEKLKHGLDSAHMKADRLARSVIKLEESRPEPVIVKERVEVPTQSVDTQISLGDPCIESRARSSVVFTPVPSMWHWWLLLHASYGLVRQAGSRMKSVRLKMNSEESKSLRRRRQSRLSSQNEQLSTIAYRVKTPDRTKTRATQLRRSITLSAGLIRERRAQVCYVLLVLFLLFLLTNYHKSAESSRSHQRTSSRVIHGDLARMGSVANMSEVLPKKSKAPVVKEIDDKTRFSNIMKETISRVGEASLASDMTKFLSGEWLVGLIKEFEEWNIKLFVVKQETSVRSEMVSIPFRDGTRPEKSFDELLYEFFLEKFETFDVIIENLISLITTCHRLLKKNVGKDDAGIEKEAVWCFFQFLDQKWDARVLRALVCARLASQKLVPLRISKNRIVYVSEKCVHSIHEYLLLDEENEWFSRSDAEVKRRLWYSWEEIDTDFDQSWNVKVLRQTRERVKITKLRVCRLTLWMRALCIEMSARWRLVDISKEEEEKNPNNETMEKVSTISAVAAQRHEHSHLIDSNSEKE